METHDKYAHRILTEIETGQPISQRSLARRLGIALGLTNLLLRRLARKGLIRIAGIKPHRVTYLITPHGLAEKARITREHLKHALTVYSEARDRIAHRLTMLSAAWPRGPGGSEKRIVFYGAAELAEIGFVCLQWIDLRLVGVIDGERSRPFFGVPISDVEALQPGRLGDVAFDVLVVMSVDDRAAIERTLEPIGYPATDLFWI